MYAVIIVMTFTSTLRHSDTLAQSLYMTIVLSALLCCVAWGVCDGVFYAWEDVYDTKTQGMMIHASKSDDKKSVADSMIKEELDDTIVGYIEESDRERLYEGIRKYLAKPEVKVKKKTFLRELPHYVFGTTGLSLGSALIVLLPFFIFGNDIRFALNVSNILGVSVLFLIGYYRSQDERFLRKFSSGMISAILGIIIALVTVVLGG